MKRFASFTTIAALAGSLVGAGNVAQANSAIYLVPISDLNATYAPGATVQFATYIDLGISAFGSFSVPGAVAYVTTQFSKPLASSAVYDTTEDPTQPGSGAPLWGLNSSVAFTTTASSIGTAKVQTIQPTNGHPAVPSADGTSTLVVPAGTYKLATFTFKIASTVSGNATVYLPTPAGYSNSANATDGAYQAGVGPLNLINGKDIKGNAISDTLTFSKANSLTFKVNGGGVPTAPVTGTLQFNEIVSFAAAQVVTFQFRDPTTGAALSSQTANVPPNGAFSLSPTPLQPYMLWIKPNKFLAHRINITVNNGAFVPFTQAFDGGDGNNDNGVDTSDFGLLVGAYGGDSSVSGSGYDLRADFNGDGLVDPTDFGILVENYGEKGDL